MVAVEEEGREWGDKKAREFRWKGRKYLVEIVSGREDRGAGGRPDENGRERSSWAIRHGGGDCSATIPAYNPTVQRARARG